MRLLSLGYLQRPGYICLNHSARVGRAPATSSNYLDVLFYTNGVLNTIDITALSSVPYGTKSAEESLNLEIVCTNFSREHICVFVYFSTLNPLKY
jgi:sulfur relay (sulfurtransferase) DsrF/TusC family protein